MAARLFRERGYEGTTVRDVAAAAGISAGSLFHHFPSKEQMLVEMLREASIVVVDVPGEPGAYKATVFLKPHFQLEELTTSIRLVADLPK